MKQRGCLGVAAAEVEQRKQALGKRRGIVEQSQRTEGTCASASNHAPLRSLIHSFHPFLLLLPVRYQAQTHPGRNFSVRLGKYGRYLSLVGHGSIAPVAQTMILNEGSGHTLADALLALLYSRRVAQIALCCCPSLDEAGSALTGRPSNEDCRRGVEGGGGGGSSRTEVLLQMLFLGGRLLPLDAGGFPCSKPTSTVKSGWQSPRKSHAT